jgi:hypothetical protein
MCPTSLFDIDVFIVKVTEGTSKISGAGPSVAGKSSGSKGIPVMSETGRADFELSFLSLLLAGTAALLKSEGDNFSLLV